VHPFSLQSLIALNLVAQLVFGMAAGPAVGLATAPGSFSIDHSRVAGNATLFEGSIVETWNTASELQLSTGARMQLAAESRGIIYRDRLVLEKGENQGNHPVEALSLRIRLADAGSTARVSLSGRNLVQVAALNGAVKVANGNGVVLASLAAGSALSFEPQEAGAAAPSTLTGCLESAGGKLMLTDETSSVRFELLGGGLDRYAGSRVLVTGTVNPGSEDMNTVRVTSLRQLAKKCSTKSAAAAGAVAGGAATGGAAAGGAAAGAAVATKAIIAGVIVAGAAAGTAIAAVKTGDDEPAISPSSR